MKTLCFIVVILTVLASTSAVESDVDDLLRQLGLSTTAKENAMKQDLDNDYDDDDDDEAIAKVMSTALINSLVDDDYDGEDSIMANLMNINNEEEASAQFRFIRRIFRRIKRSRFGRFVRRYGKRFICG